MLKPGGKVICVSEPVASDYYLPTLANKTWINNQMKHQSVGNNENYYWKSYYKLIIKMFAKFDF